MKVTQSKNRNIIVASVGGGGAEGQCPRLVTTLSKASFRDDYHDKIKTNKRLLSKLLG